MKRSHDTEIEWDQLRDLFPFACRVFERQLLRVQALKNLKAAQSPDEEQLAKIEAKDRLRTLVKLEEWK